MKFLSRLSFETFSIYQSKRRRMRMTAPANSPLHIRNGNPVCIIGSWIRVAGIWQGSSGRSVHWLAAICIICFITTTISQVIALIRAKDDREKLFECFSVLSFCGMGILKLISLKGKQDRWRVLLSNASDLENLQLNSLDPPNVEYDSDGEEDGTFQRHIEIYSKKFHATCTLLSRIYSFTAIVYILSPFIEFALYKFQGHDKMKYPHILPGWTPLDEISFLGYIFTIIAEGIAAVYCVCIHVTFDLCAVGMMIFIHGQFVLMHDYCERIGGKGKQCKLSHKRDIRAHYRISKCHLIHVSLIKSIKELSSLTQNILGIYFILATLTLCSVAVQFKSNELSNTQLVSLLQYTCATLTQLFLFCNYGDAVINESAICLGDGPFASAWWCLSPRIRREIAMLCVGMTHRCRLLAGPFHSLDLPVFILIVRTAYSYYAVIRQKTD